MNTHDGGADAPHGREAGTPEGPPGAVAATTARTSGQDASRPGTTEKAGATTGVTEEAGATTVPTAATDDAGLPDTPGTTPEETGTVEPRTGVAALSLPYRIGAAVAVAAVAAAVCVHLGMVFLHVAPSNTVTKAHGEAIDDWIYPEFEQNWKLFAPNPLQQNVAIQVRAQVRTPDGGSRTTGWYDLSAQDGRAIHGNVVPSHSQQNELRRAWDVLVATHDGENRPVGVRGGLSEAYVRRIAVMRLARGGALGADGVAERVQVRSSTTNVAPPDWSTENVSLKPVYRVMPWWTVPGDEADGGIR